MSRPAGRPAASSAALQKSWKQWDSRPLRAAKESVSPPSSRISSRQLDLIARDLTDNDHAVILFLSELRLATGSQLARRLWSSRAQTDHQARAARRALLRLERWRVVDKLPQRTGGIRGGSDSVIYCLGPAGRRLLARNGYETQRLYCPGDRYVAHTLAITELVVGLHEASLSGDLDLIELQTEPTCWRGFLGLMGARLILKPDLFVRIGSGAFEDRWWIEVDLATEASPTLSSKAQRYLAYYRSGQEQRRHGVYPRVLWTVPDRRRAEQVQAALERLPAGAQRLFAVWLYDEVAGRLVAEAAS
jgi:hypothetical protein